MAVKNEIKLMDGGTISLTDKEQLFVEYYLADPNRNGMRAARKAGYKDPRTPGRMLSKPHIVRYIKEKTAPLLEALGITQERVLRKMRDIAFTDLADITDDDWRLLPKDEISKEHHPALAEFQVEERIVKSDKGQIVVDRKYKYKMKQQEKYLLTLAEMTGLIAKQEGKDPDEGDQKSINQMFLQVNNYIQNK